MWEAAWIPVVWNQHGCDSTGRQDMQHCEPLEHSLGSAITAAANLGLSTGCCNPEDRKQIVKERLVWEDYQEALSAIYPSTVILTEGCFLSFLFFFLDWFICLKGTVSERERAFINYFTPQMVQDWTCLKARARISIQISPVVEKRPKGLSLFQLISQAH